MNFFKQLFLSDRNIMFLIAINSLVIFLQGFPPETISDQTQHYLMIIDDVVTILFIFELFVKVNHLGWKPYIDSNWNKLDFFLIIVSLPPLILHLFPQISTELNIGFILIFRIFRIFKFIRFIKFFPDVEHIFRSVSIAMKASFTVFIGFIVLIFITSILSCNLYHEISPTYFGDPITSLYSIFKIYTVEGWNAIPDEMCAEGNISDMSAFFTKFFFSVIMFFGGVYGLSIVNSIFVDAMVSDNNEEVQDKIARIEDKVNQLDKKMDTLLDTLNK